MSLGSALQTRSQHNAPTFLHVRGGHGIPFDICGCIDVCPVLTYCLPWVTGIDLDCSLNMSEKQLLLEMLPKLTSLRELHIGVQRDKDPFPYRCVLNQCGAMGVERLVFGYRYGKEALTVERSDFRSLPDALLPSSEENSLTFRGRQIRLLKANFMDNFLSAAPATKELSKDPLSAFPDVGMTTDKQSAPECDKPLSLEFEEKVSVKLTGGGKINVDIKGALECLSFSYAGAPAVIEVDQPDDKKRRCHAPKDRQEIVPK